jgi:NitT/TauT family transport system substrate-binding protein
MRTKRASWLACMAAAVAVAVSLGACSSAAPSNKSSSSKLTHITVAVVPIVDAAPYFLAVKEGYFKQEGLSVTTKVVAQSTLALPSLLQGSAQVVTGANYVSFLAAQAKGAAKLSIVAPDSACASHSVAILTMPGSKIKTVAGLAHKTIAVNINPNIQTLTINALLRASNVNPSTVTYVPIPFPDAPAALKAGRVDAISTVEPFITSSETSLGAVPVADECSGPNNDILLAGNFATQSWVAKNRATALAYQRAIEKGNALADSNREAVEKIIPTFVKGITPEEAALFNLETFPTTQDATQVGRVVGLMQTGGMLKAKLNVSPIMLHQ